MRFRVAQTVGAPRKAVIGAITDPRLYQSMGPIGSLGAPDVLECSPDGDVVRMRIRYFFVGELSRAARAVLDPSKMSWVVDLDVDRKRKSAGFTMIPDHYPDRITSSGGYTFEKSAGATEQIMEGDLTVHAPLVARVVENAIVSGLRGHMAEQSRVIERFVDEHRDDAGSPGVGG